MKFETLTIQNFLSIKSIKLDLADRGLVLIKGVNQDNDSLNNNGSGKSSMIEALVYALYGRTIRGVKGDGVVNNIVGKNMKIFLDLTDDNGDKYRIARYRKHSTNKNKSFLFRNGKDVTPKSEMDFNKAVADLLQADYVTFTSSLLYSAESFKFTSSSDAEMKATFDNMLGLDIFSNCLDITKNMLREVEADISAKESSIEFIKSSIKTTEERIKDSHEKELEFEDKKKENISKLQATLESYKNSLEDFKVTASELQESLQDAKKVADKAQEVYEKRRESAKKIDELKSEISNISNEISDENQSIKRINRSISSLQSDIDDFDHKINRNLTKIESLREKKKNLDTSIGQPCPTCGQPMTSESFEPARREYDEQISDLQDTVNSLQKRKKSANDDICSYNEKIERSNSRIFELEEELEEFNKILKKSNKLVTEKDDAEDALRAANKRLSSIESDIKVNSSDIKHETSMIESTELQIRQTKEEKNPYKSIIEKYEDEIKQNQDKVAKQEEEIQNRLDEKDCLEFWKLAYSNQGIKSLILDDITPFLNRRVNKYLRKLTSGRIEAQFTTQTTLKSGEVRDKFSVTVTNVDGGVDYISNSGGEKKRVDLAINLALCDLVASRSTKKFDLLIMDEALDALDENGIESVIELLRDLEKEKSSIFIISHNEHIKSYITNTITVVKHGGFSTLLGSEDIIETDEQS